MNSSQQKTPVQTADRTGLSCFEHWNAVDRTLIHCATDEGSAPFGPQVSDNESFYLTFLGGTVGILSLDALELSPRWDDGVGDTGDHDRRANNTISSDSAGSGSRSGGATKVSDDHHSKGTKSGASAGSSSRSGGTATVSDDHHTKDTNSGASTGSGSRSGGAATVSGAPAPSEEVPLLGEAQWQRLAKILEEKVRDETGQETARTVNLCVKR